MRITKDKINIHSMLAFYNKKCYTCDGNFFVWEKTNEGNIYFCIKASCLLGACANVGNTDALDQIQ